MGEIDAMKHFIERTSDGTFMIVDANGQLIDEEKYSTWVDADRIRQKYNTFSETMKSKNTTTTTRPDFLPPDFGPYR